MPMPANSAQRRAPIARWPGLGMRFLEFQEPHPGLRPDRPRAVVLAGKEGWLCWRVSGGHPFPACLTPGGVGPAKGPGGISQIVKKKAPCEAI